MSWIDTAVDDFCRGMGLEAAHFAGAGRVQLSFERSGTLHIEQHQDNLYLMLSRVLPWHQSATRLQSALALCHFQQGWPFNVRCGLLDEETLVFTALLESEEVTLPALEQAFGLLVRLHDETERS